MNRGGAFIAYAVSCGVLILASCVSDDPGFAANGATDPPAAERQNEHRFLETISP